MSNADHDILDHELDALLDQARWPEPPPQAVAELRQQCRALSDVRPRRLLHLGWLAAAAVIVLAIGGTWFLWTQGGRVAPQIAERMPASLPPPIATPPPSPSPVATPRVAIVPQQPTPRERLVVMARSAPVVDVRVAVGKAIDATLEERYGDAVVLLRQLRTEPVERELVLTFATATNDGRRRAAIRLLSELGGPPSAALLTRVASEAKFAAEAMPGVARLGGVEPLARLARSAQRTARREAVEQLLALGTEPAVESFLSLVLDDATRDDALAALRDAPAPPVERLIGALDDAKVAHRFAAAKALGSLCHREDVGQALRRMVAANQHRREALAALLSCPGEAASTFIKSARTRPSIDSEVRAVQTELQRMF